MREPYFKLNDTPTIPRYRKSVFYIFHFPTSLRSELPRGVYKNCGRDERGERIAIHVKVYGRIRHCKNKALSGCITEDRLLVPAWEAQPWNWGGSECENSFKLYWL